MDEFCFYSYIFSCRPYGCVKDYLMIKLLCSAALRPLGSEDTTKSLNILTICCLLQVWNSLGDLNPSGKSLQGPYLEIMGSPWRAAAWRGLTWESISPHTGWVFGSSLAQAEGNSDISTKTSCDWLLEVGLRGHNFPAFFLSPVHNALLACNKCLLLWMIIATVRKWLLLIGLKG